MENRVKRLLRIGKPAFGGWVMTPSPDIAEIMSNVGFDWILFDNEHGPLNFETTQSLIQATNGTKTIPLVRVPWNDPVYIKRSLDIGAYGIVIPWVNNREDALKAVRSSKYPPTGFRGVGPRRASKYGLDFEDYIKRANEELLVIVQIETIEAVENLDEILSVEGVDAFFIGPQDLAGSLGHLGKPQHPEVMKMISNILEKSKHGRASPGIHAFSPELALEYASMGFRFIAVSTDTSLIKSCREALAKIRGAEAEKEGVGY